MHFETVSRPGGPNAATERGQPFRLAVAFAARAGHRFVVLLFIYFFFVGGGGVGFGV